MSQLTSEPTEQVVKRAFTSEQKVQAFRRELSYIKNDDVRTIVEDLLEEVPNYFFEIPASSTGKYHPDYALGTGGLVRHTKAACLFGNILRVANPLQLSEFELDCAIGGIILHDTRKLGMSDNVKATYTLFSHPLLAANAIRSAYSFEELSGDTDAETKKVLAQVQKIAFTIAESIESHMGQWNTSRQYPGVILPLPKTPIQHFVHICDYLASKKELDIKNLF